MKVWIVTQEDVEWKYIIGVYSNEAAANAVVWNPPEHEYSYLNHMSTYVSTQYGVEG